LERILSFGIGRAKALHENHTFVYLPLSVLRSYFT